MRQRRRTGCGFVLLFLASLVILGAAWFYTTWTSGATVLPPGLTINGVPMGGMTRDQALRAIEQAYTLPIAVTYAGKPIPDLLPEIIELRVDMEATAENLDEALAVEPGGQIYVRYFLDELRGREHETIAVKAVVLYARDRVDDFLERTAQKYDHPPRAAVALPESNTFRPPVDGTTLDIAASLPLVIDAILAADPDDRQVALVVDVEPAPEISLDVLDQALRTTLSGFDGVAGIFIKDLHTGQELCLNCEVAFGGRIVADIGTALTAYTQQTDTPDEDVDAQMTRMLSHDASAEALDAADALLARIGDGDPYRGARGVTDVFWALGLTNSYLAAPHDVAVGVSPTPIGTFANARTDIATDPDPIMQTTPLEAALLLENLYHCTQGGGALRALYPHAITPERCEDIVASIEGNRARSRLALHIPPEMPVTVAIGDQGTTHAEVAIVDASRTPFVLAVYLHSPAAAAPELVPALFAHLGRLATYYFDGGAGPQSQ